jgi:hypothetical protein
MEDKIEKIITAGFRRMNLDDFEESLDNKMEKYEDSIGFIWAWYVKSFFPQLHVSSQVQVENNRRGKNPCIDFVINGENDIGFELIRNGNTIVCKEHANRFEDEYKRWRNSCAVVNMILSGNQNVKKLYGSQKNPVFHYLKSKNALYKGNQILNRSVSKNIPTPSYKKEFCSIIHLGSKILYLRS